LALYSLGLLGGELPIVIRKENYTSYSEQNVKWDQRQMDIIDKTFMSYFSYKKYYLTATTECVTDLD